MRKTTKTAIIVTSSAIAGSNVLLKLVALFLIVAILICSCIGIVSIFAINHIGTNKVEQYLNGIENQPNSQHFLHLTRDEVIININNKCIVDANIDTYCGLWSKGSAECFGATDEELFYYIEEDNCVEFYSANYKNRTYKKTRSFNYDVILYHKNDKLIYIGEDGKNHIFDGFDLTDDVYDGEIPTNTPRYTVTSDKRGFIIKDNQTNEEKKTIDLKKAFKRDERVKNLGVFANIKNVFTHNDKIYVVYTSYDYAVVFELDFENQSLSLVQWGKILSYSKGNSSTWYLDRVKFD